MLLERLIVYRPHPWGLLVTFIELIKGEEYNFWKHRSECIPYYLDYRFDDLLFE